MRPVTAAFSGCLALLLLACASTVADLEVELPEIPTGWSTPLAAAADPGTAWWLEFETPGLVEAVERALATNPSLEAQQARVDVAVAQARISGASLEPRIGLGLNGGRRRQNFIGFPIPGAEQGVLTTTSTTLGVSLDTAWEVDLWGSGRARRNSAQAGARAAMFDLAAARLSLVGQTAKAWVALAEAAAQFDLAQSTAENRSLARGRIERRFELGLVGSLEVRLSAGRHELARANLARSRSDRDARRRTLETLLRRYPAGEITAEALPGLPTLESDAMPTGLVARRPDLRALEARLDQAGYSLLEARRALYPRLSLNGSIGRTADEIDALLNSDFDVGSLAGGLLQPLFQGGRLRAGIDLAEARREEIVAVYVQSLLDAYREVETLIAADARLAEVEAALAEAEASSRAAEQLALREYEQGISDFLTLLQAQRDHFEAASSSLTVRALRVSNRIDLHLALADGLTFLVPDPGESAGSADLSTESQEPDDA